MRKEISNEENDWVVIMFKAEAIGWAWIKPVGKSEALADAVMKESVELRDAMFAAMRLPQASTDLSCDPHAFVSLAVAECSQKTREGFVGAELINAQRPGIHLDLSMCAQVLGEHLEKRSLAGGEEVYGPVRFAGKFGLRDMADAARRMALASRVASEIGVAVAAAAVVPVPRRPTL